MSESTGKIRLLVADDEESFLKAVSRRLELKDFDVVTATRGRDAVKAARRGRFDVALLDLRMPDLDGEEVLGILKKKHKYLEVIILTGHASIDSAVECTRLGAFDYLQKPYDFDALMEVLRRAYEARLRKKFEHDRKRMKDLEFLSMGASPAAILRALISLDDDEK
jgi:DNA-binding NtrC family response regulator